MDAGRLRTGELIAGVAAVLLFIVMFLGWFGVGDVETGIPGVDVEGFAEAAGIDTTASAWQAFSFIDIVLLVTIVVAVGLAAATAMAQTVALPVAASALTAGLGILSTLLILYRIIDPPEEAARELWVFVGLVLAAAIAYGGWRSMQEEGTTFGGQADRPGDRAGGGPADRTPPPAAPSDPGTTPPPPSDPGAPPPGAPPRV